MKNIEEMKGQLFALVDDVRKMVETAKEEKRDLTAEEMEKQERQMTEIRALEKEIAMETELQRIEAMKAQRNIDPEKDKAEWRSLGEFVQAVAFNPTDRRLTNRQVVPQAQATGADGGYLVPDQYAKDILTVAVDEAIIRPRARVFTGATSAGFGQQHIPALDYGVDSNMFAGAEVAWISEGAEKPPTKVGFKRVTLHPFEVAAHVPITDRLLQNGPIIENMVRTQLRAALIGAEEKAFLLGTGANNGQPTGIIGHAATITVNRGTANTVAYADLAAMFQRLHGRRGVWIVGRGVLPQLMGLKDAANHFIWQPNARDGNPGTLFGLPVLFSEYSPELGDVGDVLLADLSYYLIGDGMGISIGVSPHVYFTSNITVIKAWKTVDGTPWLTAPLPTKFATSPFVELGDVS
ncbi:MAG: phage major capsid protein [Candidatus Thermoplasmatota archaeon]|nr:phage major capsid protein [Candidatus Thermoplasmatota archaeon]